MTPAHEWPVGIQLQIQDVNCKTYLHSCQLEDSHEDLHSQKVPVAAICGGIRLAVRFGTQSKTQLPLINHNKYSCSTSDYIMIHHL